MDIINQKQKDFLLVLTSHKDILYKVAKSYCKNSDDINDLVQEIIFHLWKSFDNYNSQFKYSTWIYRLALNVAITFYRKENTRKPFANPLTENLLNFSDITTSIELDKSVNLLYQFIAELKELDKALMLLYLDERNYKEMAGILGITETNVATKIGRIKIKLKEKFEVK
jgi:RNA polymerase sigma-70 factor (ECF subfamily)